MKQYNVSARLDSFIPSGHDAYRALKTLVLSNIYDLFPLQAITATGIKIVNRVEIPPELVPDDAKVEITAKVFHGYNAGKAYQGIDEDELKKTKGRDYAYDSKDNGKE